jgi:nucleoside-diphosphate-sugar epimerase
MSELAADFHIETILAADISELTEDTGFVPDYTFEEGIKETVEWYKKEYTR